MRFSRAIERQHRIRRSRFIVRDSSHPPNIEGAFSQKNSTHRTDRPRLECFSTLSDPNLHPDQPAPKEHPCPRSSSHSWFGNGFHRLSMIGMPENWEGEPSTVLGRNEIGCDRRLTVSPVPCSFRFAIHSRPLRKNEEEGKNRDRNRPGRLREPEDQSSKRKLTALLLV